MTRARLRLAAASAVVALVALVAAYELLPGLVERRLRAELVNAGFPDARLEVASIGLHHLQLRDVHLQPGVDVGSVRVGGGQLAIRDARVSFAKLVELGQTFSKLRHTGASHGALAVTIEAGDPQGGWSAHGSGHVRWGGEVAVDGAMELDIPRMAAGPLEMTNIHVPVSLDASGIHVHDASATVAGGTLSLDANVSTTGTAGIVVRARGVQMAKLLARTHRVNGTGLVDGELALKADHRGWSIERGELHARSGGTLQVNDAALRASVADTKSPFSIHTKLATALMDFEYDTLTAKLANPGTAPEVKVATRGRGRTNHQELDLAINVRGLLGGE